MTVAAVVGYLVHRQTAGYWDRLTAAKSEFEEVNGFMAAPEVREGSTVCVITCGGGGEATLSARYEVEAASEVAAVRQASSALSAAFGDPDPLALGDVLPRTALPSVGSGAYALVEMSCPQHASETFRCTMTLRLVSGIE